MALQLLATETSIMAIRLNTSFFLALMNRDLDTNSFINSTVYNLFERRLGSSEILDIIEANLESLNGTTLTLLLANSLTTEQQVIMKFCFLSLLLLLIHRF